ncbi:hypothetical protein [Ensifer sp. NM-2]|uniref:hypothetical protein n=1 Tax=Ensifer sp. NM-2 TaxID=2109730 RepID=UPI0011B23651|nr:hypothetical protein [Ensifer sp. NM-2]
MSVFPEARKRPVFRASRPFSPGIARLPETAFGGRRHVHGSSSSPELSFPRLPAGSFFRSHLQSRYFSGISATEARWRAFAYADAQSLVSRGDLSLASRYYMLKTRLQLINFSRIPYLYKSPRNGPLKAQWRSDKQLTITSFQSV